MIVAYTDKFPNTLEYIRNLTGEQVRIRTDILKGSPASLFSESPYILVFDAISLQNRAFRKAICREEFSGSKILYCIYLTENIAATDFSSIVAAKKDLVLFGSESVFAPADKLSDEEANKLLGVSASILSRCFIGGKCEKHRVFARIAVPEKCKA